MSLKLLTVIVGIANIIVLCDRFHRHNLRRGYHEHPILYIMGVSNIIGITDVWNIRGIRNHR
jgi:hypothetical protein